MKKVNVVELFSDFPIIPFLDEIVQNDEKYIIVEAETGSGKSTAVSLALQQAGMSCMVTEPLIETVVGTSEFVARSIGEPLGGLVGYQTAEYRQAGRATEILYCTDGLALVSELAGNNRFQVLVIDELHEWNTNQSTLEAWAWKGLQDGTLPFDRVVVLSATLNSEELSQKRGNAPIFKVPGRQYPIQDWERGRSIVRDVAKLVSKGYDVLVFQPGMREIKQTVRDLEEMSLSAELIPFHGSLDRVEKDRAYKSYKRPKVIVSTNALETGRTIVPSEGRELAVVDSGLERRIELVDGIEGLYLMPIAKSSSKQRRGRTGRVGNGVYIDHCPVDPEERPDYPVAEILRTRLDLTVLRLATFGYDVEELPFFHELKAEEIADAKRSLKALGAMKEDGSVTEIGRRMARMPIKVQFSRMLIEAEKRRVLSEVLTIAAILEVGGITQHKNYAWTRLTEEKESDLLAQLDIWEEMRKRRVSAKKLSDHGVDKKRYFQAKEVRRNLDRALQRLGMRFHSTGDREEILKACVAGMVDHVFLQQWGRTYKNGGPQARDLDEKSVVRTYPEWIVGLPFDLPFTYVDRAGIEQQSVKHLVVMASSVTPECLVEVAPQLYSVQKGYAPFYSSETDSVMSEERELFNGQVIIEKTVKDPDHPEAVECFADWLSMRMS